MARIQVLLLILVVLSGVICHASKSKEKEPKRTSKPVELKKNEKKSTNGKRESPELAEPYIFGQKDESFRPIYQFNNPGAPFKGTAINQVTAETGPQLSDNKPNSIVSSNAEPPHHVTINNEDTRRSIQHAVTNSDKTEGGIDYGPNSLNPSSYGGSHYVSSDHRGPFVSALHQASIGQARGDPIALYSAAPVQHPSASLVLPLHHGGINQPLPPQPHQQNQYAIAFPVEYMRHYQHNLAAPFPLHGAQMVQLVYNHNTGSLNTALPAAPKDQPNKQGAVQYITLTPHVTPPQGSHSLVAGPAFITHIIPYYESSGSHHRQGQYTPPPAFYFGAFNQQPLPNSLEYSTTFPHQQQSIHKQQIYRQIQIEGGGGAAAVAAAVPFKPMVDPVHQQQQLQHLTQSYHHYHPGAAGYSRYSQSASGPNGSGGSSNPVEVPTYEPGSTSAPKQGLLYSLPSPSNNPGSTYSGSAENSGGKMTYRYGADPSYEGPMYAHPGALHYGTHLYHPSRNVVQIGSNRVTAGSAAIAGVSPPSYHPQPQSPANNSHGGRGSSSSAMKFA